ncbi:hypothetical protein [Streptomyces sp. NPDC056600]|uniref:hypothetical protein n=1 Tax=Streptomyces sp. NPDC056600 TaxID=3345874 RepID=UPI0036AC1DC0
MGDRANVIVVHENGTHELYRTGWAVGIDLDLLEGPAPVLGMLPELRQDGWWLDDSMAQGGILLDLGRKVLLLFAWEGPSTELRHRAATFELIRAAWPGWDVRWLYDGPAELRAHVGLDPEHVRCRDANLGLAPFLAPGDADLAGPDPGGVVITVGTGHCHIVSDAFDHPVREGPALLHRLATAPRHESCHLHVNSGIHLDPERRHLGWWSLSSTPRAYQVPEAWPGWPGPAGGGRHEAVESAPCRGPHRVTPAFGPTRSPPRPPAPRRGRVRGREPGSAAGTSPGR